MGAGVRDAFPPPMCVWIVYAFRLGGLRVNGYLVWVGLRGKILRSVVGAVPMCPPVSPPQGCIYRSIPRAQCVCFWYRNAAVRTFGRAHRRRPYAFCLRELRVDVRPYSFVWVDCVWAVDIIWVDYAWMGWFRLGKIVRKCITEMGREESPRRESWHVCLLHQTHGFGLFHEQGHERFALVGHLIVEHGIPQGLF